MLQSYYVATCSKKSNGRKRCAFPISDREDWGTNRPIEHTSHCFDGTLGWLLTLSQLSIIPHHVPGNSGTHRYMESKSWARKERVSYATALLPGMPFTQKSPLRSTGVLAKHTHATNPMEPQLLPHQLGRWICYV
eukprot:648067-Amphidinium_carterae.1